MPITPIVCTFAELETELGAFPLLLEHLSKYCPAGVCDMEDTVYLVFYHQDVDLCYVYLLPKDKIEPELISGPCGGTLFHQLVEGSELLVPAQVEYQVQEYMDKVGVQELEQRELFEQLQTTVFSLRLKLKLSISFKSLSFGYDGLGVFGLIIQFYEHIRQEEQVFTFVNELLPLLRPVLAQYGLRYISEKNVFSLSFMKGEIELFMPLETMLFNPGGKDPRLN